MRKKRLTLLRQKQSPYKDNTLSFSDIPIYEIEGFIIGNIHALEEKRKVAFQKKTIQFIDHQILIYRNILNIIQKDITTKPTHEST